jgi:transcriptional regulator with XRE-family HTH domain
VDWIRLGLAFRALRIRHGWRQIDLAGRAGVSRGLISLIERGGGGSVTLDTLANAAALEARLDASLRWRGEHLDRLLDAAHARLVERVAALLADLDWDVLVEVSFAIGGERGSIDVLGRHRSTGAILVVEVKSVVPDSQAMLHAQDRKARLAPRIAAERGWTTAGLAGRLLVVGAGSTARRRIDALGATYRAALPDRGPSVRSWLRDPSGALAGLPDRGRPGPGSTPIAARPPGARGAPDLWALD